MTTALTREQARTTARLIYAAKQRRAALVAAEHAGHVAEVPGQPTSKLQRIAGGDDDG